MGSNSYLVFSFHGKDILAIPKNPSRLGRVGVKLYKDISVRRWLFKVAIRLAMLARVERLVGRETSTPVPRHPNFDFEGWLDQARQDLGISNVQAFVIFPTSHFNRGRFYVHMLSSRTEPLAFAKVLGTENDHRLMREAKAMRDLAGQTFQSFRVPKVLAEGKFDSHHYLIMEPMPARARPVPADWGAIPQRCRDELAGSSCRLKLIEELSWWGRFHDKAGEFRPLLEAIDVDGNREIPVCFAHGDFAHTNMCLVNDEVWLFDWENSSSDAPVMTDEVRFFLSMQGRVASKPNSVAAALGRRYLTSGSASTTRNLALALAFLCAGDLPTGLICGRYWDHIIHYDKG